MHYIRWTIGFAFAVLAFMMGTPPDSVQSSLSAWALAFHWPTVSNWISGQHCHAAFGFLPYGFGLLAFTVLFWPLMKLFWRKTVNPWLAKNHEKEIVMQLVKEYEITHPGQNEAPFDWINRRLAEKGYAFAVTSPPQKTISAISAPNSVGTTIKNIRFILPNGMQAADLENSVNAKLDDIEVIYPQKKDAT
jgi:hypothetical protein